MANESRDPLNDTAALRALSGNEDIMNDTSMGVPQDEALLNAGLSGAIAQQAERISGGGSEEPDTDWVRRQEKQPSSASKQTSSLKANRAANQSRAAKLKREQARATAMQFRKTAIPLLLIMGVVLLGMGGYMVHLVGGADEIDKAENALLKHGNLFAGIAFVLGVCLIAGAGFFQYEVLAEKRKQDHPQAPDSQANRGEH